MVPAVSKKDSPLASALSDEEIDELALLLDEHSPFDLDGVFGLLHAVGVAPTMMPPSAWIPIVLPDGIGALDQEGARTLLFLLLRLYNDVVNAVNAREALLPEEDDVKGCDAFAAGYLAGAELDPAWIGDDDKWTFASWSAYLANRHELVTPRHLVELDKNPVESRASVRREMGAMIVSAYETFAKARRQLHAGAKAARSTRTGRNDPCPCGSGKKYKRCCIDGTTTVTH